MAAEAVKAGYKLGPYELLAPIGAGGMGEVWKARDTRLDRVVAIKFSQAQFTERFEREARAIAALNYPNIAQIYDVGENYIVMECVEGEPLRAPDSTRKVLELAVQIADGLAAAHAAGIVHRDLKPDNILVTKPSRVKILDFGVAKQTMAGQSVATITATQPGTMVGTVAYMSPEQARGQELDVRSDQFAFGLILYEMLAGKRAFSRDTGAELLTAIIREEPDPLPLDVPLPLRWAVERCLTKDPENRFDTTRGLYLELRNLRERLSVTTAIVAAAKPASAPRMKLTAVFAAGAVLLAAAVLGSLTFAPSPTVDLSRYRFTPFAVTTENETSPVWSPDGRSIAYTIQQGTRMRLVVKGVGGGAPVTLVESRNLLYPSWSVDGERIYYQDRSSSPGFIAYVSRAGGEPTRLWPDNEAGAPAMSPIADTLAVLVQHEVDGKRERQLALSKPQGAAPKPFGPMLPCCLTPPMLVWAPDGNHIMVHICPTTTGAVLYGGFRLTGGQSSSTSMHKE